jgi:signal transduction histidine kinase
MQERVALLRGRCVVKSKLGAGTQVIADVPLEPPVEGREDDGA